MVAFIRAQRTTYRVESICQLLPIAPSTQYDRKARERDPSRCIVERLIRQHGFCGVVRRKTCFTAILDPLTDRPEDLVQRNFTATRPNQLWVSDLIYVVTWRGMVYAALVTAAVPRRIVGCRPSTSMHTDLALDASEQVLYDRDTDATRVDHTDRGSQHVAIRDRDRLLEVGVESSVGGRGDAYDSALAETINGLYKTDVIDNLGSWKRLEDVAYAALEWVAWYNSDRLMEPLGSFPPAEYEEQFHRARTDAAVPALN